MDDITSPAAAMLAFAEDNDLMEITTKRIMKLNGSGDRVDLLRSVRLDPTSRGRLVTEITQAERAVLQRLCDEFNKEPFSKSARFPPWISPEINVVVETLGEKPIQARPPWPFTLKLRPVEEELVEYGGYRARESYAVAIYKVPKKGNFNAEDAFGDEVRCRRGVRATVCWHA